ncbi:hypothetical protein H0I76_14185 [Limibaculum sp. M0105]|uniref:PH domain-containing protein n=1 Tax=Thermohalobaculum xanthum TaxID=2753746 RepID=A0A8J7M8U9_9RHOB|nr:hypothetical protein [Thermohalobaculum xanthum]MBK0400345.1 hypothetical protein [Thermohalobaculum xanthum]
MSFVRPEAAALVRRWAEPAAAAVLLLAAGREAVIAFGAGRGFGWIALAAALLAALWLRVALVRALSAQGGEAPGVVEIREREIRFFGPYAGGSVDLDALVRIEVVVPARGVGALWRLAASDGHVLVVPAVAQGAEKLIDAFSALPGFSDLAAAGALRREAPGSRLVWERPAAPAGVAAISRS